MTQSLTGITSLPYVIDNRRQVLADVLRDLLGRHGGLSLDVATAYFSVGGFGLLKEGLRDLGSFRLLLGAEPLRGEQIGLWPESARVKGLIRKDLEDLRFDEEALRLVEDLIGYLRRPGGWPKVRREGVHAVRSLPQSPLRVLQGRSRVGRPAGGDAVGGGAFRVPGGCGQEGAEDPAPAPWSDGGGFGGAGEDLDREKAPGRLCLPPADEGSGELPGT